MSVRRGNRLYAAVALLGLASGPLCAAPIHIFDGPDGMSPQAGLLAGAGGILYGTTQSGGDNGNGVVFALTPPPSGKTKWTETVLYSFSGNEEPPNSGLIADAAGNLYGTTARTVYALSPPASGPGPWTKTVLAAIVAGDFVGGVAFDADGNLYALTSGGGSGFGAVYEVSPPMWGQGPWTLTTLYAFAGAVDGATPQGGVTIGANGSLFGTTTTGGAGNWGTVFALTPPAGGQTPWTHTILTDFYGTTPDLTSDDGGAPSGNLAIDAAGALYGTTVRGGMGPCHTGCGTVYRLSPPAGSGVGWTRTTLHMMGSPNARDGQLPEAGLTIDGNGVLYGTASYAGRLGYGAVFQLKPPPAGKPNFRWPEQVLHAFNFSDGQAPLGPVTFGPNGQLYGTTSAGGATSAPPYSPGTVFALKP